MSCKTCGKHKGHALTCSTFRTATAEQIGDARTFAKPKQQPSASASPRAPQRRMATADLDEAHRRAAAKVFGHETVAAAEAVRTLNTMTMDALASLVFPDASKLH